MPVPQPFPKAVWPVWIVVIGSALVPVAAGIRVIRMPDAIRNEPYSGLPIEGPVTDQELRLAQSRAAGLGVMPGEVSRENLERIVSAERTLRKLAFEKERQRRVDRAESRRWAGWLLIGIGAAVMATWAWAWASSRRGAANEVVC